MRKLATLTLNTQSECNTNEVNSAFHRIILRLQNGIGKPLNKVTLGRNFIWVFFLREAKAWSPIL
jgi:hypothetical protein